MAIMNRRTILWKTLAGAGGLALADFLAPERAVN